MFAKGTHTRRIPFVTPICLVLFRKRSEKREQKAALKSQSLRLVFLPFTHCNIALETMAGQFRTAAFYEVQRLFPIFWFPFITDNAFWKWNRVGFINFIHHTQQQQRSAQHSFLCNQNHDLFNQNGTLLGIATKVKTQVLCCNE